MAERIRLVIDGRAVSVAEGTSVAAALLGCGFTTFRHSVTGEPRAAVCGMGICFECRVTIDGQAHRRACQILCREGMRVETE
jgi:predicted molibdopterin-dependent oxidoreductase YjgC